MYIIIPISIALLGLMIGLTAGIFLKPSQNAELNLTDLSSGPIDYIKFTDQFVVPVVEGERVTSMVVLSLGIEVANKSGDQVHLKEPRLRDAFLQTLFIHANSGGFRGSFTNSTVMDELRSALKEQAFQIIGPDIKNVLITEIMRQDI